MIAVPTRNVRCPPSVLLWIRQDLRLADNPALSAALERGSAVLPVFVWAPEEEDPWAPGAASRWWLHQSLARWGPTSRRGSRLAPCPCGRRRTAAIRAHAVGNGDHDAGTLGALRALLHDTGARAVYWNRRYEPAVVARDRTIKQSLRDAGIEAESFNAALLAEPWDVRNQSGRPFQVFTPFWKHVRAALDPPRPAPAPAAIPPPPSWPASLPLEALELQPTIRWDGGLAAAWEPGERGAARHLERFLGGPVRDYDEARNVPGLTGTSRLSPHLHFGELSPRQVWHAAPGSAAAPACRSSMPACASCGTTGWMHNRVRMVVASFLTKDLRLPLAGRRALVLGHAGRRRSREQHARLAVDGRLRRRRRAVLPRLQPGAAGRSSTPGRRRYAAALAARARARAMQGKSARS
jgi:deoxyribodipyrimidine photo-lyase